MRTALCIIVAALEADASLSWKHPVIAVVPAAAP
jgi:hypothetical protein